MLFKSLGVAIATNNASNSDEDLKPITIRLAELRVRFSCMTLFQNQWV